VDRRSASEPLGNTAVPEVCETEKLVRSLFRELGIDPVQDFNLTAEEVEKVLGTQDQKPTTECADSQSTKVVPTISATLKELERSLRGKTVQYGSTSFTKISQHTATTAENILRSQ
jgi:hypothetical protein